MRGGSLVRSVSLNGENILTETTGQTDPYRTEVRLARLCFQMLKTSRWSPRFAVGKVVKPSCPTPIGYPTKQKNNERKEQRRSPEIKQGAEEDPGRDRKIQRPAI